VQRRKVRTAKRQEYKRKIPLLLTHKRTKRFCLEQYGLYADPRLTITQNFNKTLQRSDSVSHYLPTQLTFHNLCTTNKIPTGTRQLLGLNLKFCLASKRLTENINYTIKNMAYCIRNAYYLKQSNTANDTDYIKQIYVKNTQWHPPPAPIHVEDKMTAFEKAFKAAQIARIRKTSKINLRNLTLPQLKTMQQLKMNKSFIIKPTDKNLGPAILDTETYVAKILSEHLLTKDYKQLTEAEAITAMSDIKTKLKNIINDNQHILSKSEVTYFKRSLLVRHRLPLFYGLPKVHKTPFTLRPVVSGTNGLLTVFSTWLDYKMKELLPMVQSYIKNSYKVIEDLTDMIIPEKAKLFSADATSMYTNIDTDTGINAIKNFLSDNSESLPLNFPTNLFLQVLKTVMENNIFCFGDSYWLQLSGTAMGTPVACAYAMVSFGQHENAVILPRFSANLLYFKRYIDDIFGIWLPAANESTDTWEDFKTTLNAWGSLRWVVEEPSSSTIFLDLTVQIQNSRIRFTTFQKPMNLYLYIPPSSAHPTSCLKGLIMGELRRYWLQNDPDTFQTILLKFITRLLHRGHDITNISPILLEAAHAISKTNKSGAAPLHSPSNTLYLHWAYHPHGLQRKDIRRIFDNTLKPALDCYDKMQIAISRPKNLREILTRAAFNTCSINDRIACQAANM